MTTLHARPVTYRALPAAPGRLRLLLSLFLCMCFSGGLVAADQKPTAARLSAAQVIDKHVAARGGLQAWRAVQTLSMTGQMDAGSGDAAVRSARLAHGGMGASIRRGHATTAAGPAAGPDSGAADQQVQLPFTLEMKRPRKSRLEIEVADKIAVQVYDGTNGWKLRPFLNRSDAEPFTAEEAKSEAGRADMDGPLLDYAAKGTKVELAGVEAVEGHDAYKLKLTAKNGTVQHIWIDAQSFLDVKVEGIPRKMDGRVRTVSIYQRDFRSVQGLMIPFVYETAVEGFPQTHKMTIQTVTVNRALDDSRFAKPQASVVALPAAPASTKVPVAATK